MRYARALFFSCCCCCIFRCALDVGYISGVTLSVVSRKGGIVRDATSAERSVPELSGDAPDFAGTLYAAVLLRERAGGHCAATLV